jgi:DNA helicase II / ATP-dependent DNA helicase PcrA
LIALRLASSIGQVIAFIAGQPHMRRPEAVEDRERRLREAGAEPIEGKSRRIGQLRNVPYTEIIALDRFIDGHTPFATKHPPS